MHLLTTLQNHTSSNALMDKLQCYLRVYVLNPIPGLDEKGGSTTHTWPKCGQQCFPSCFIEFKILKFWFACRACRTTKHACCLNSDKKYTFIVYILTKEPDKILVFVLPLSFKFCINWSFSSILLATYIVD